MRLLYHTTDRHCRNRDNARPHDKTENIIHNNHIDKSTPMAYRLQGNGYPIIATGIAMSYHNLLSDDVPALLADPDVVVLDIRDRSSYDRGHIDGALLADDTVIGNLVRQRRQDPPILVYCYHGISSQEMSGFLAGLGFTRVHNLEGGWQAWESRQLTCAAPMPAQTLAWVREQGFSGDDLNQRIANGMTPLMTAAVHGRVDLAEALLQAGAGPNLVNDDGNNALWFACYSGNVGLILLLIAQGIDMDNRNVNGATCLIYAASAGKFEVVQALVEAGADLTATTDDGFSALDSAASLPVLKYLRARGAAA